MLKRIWKRTNAKEYIMGAVLLSIVFVFVLMCGFSAYYLIKLI